MAGLIYEYIFYPIIAASGGEFSGLAVLVKVVLFLLILFALMYGVPVMMMSVC